MLNNQNSGEGQLLQQQSDLGQPPSPLVIGRRKKNSVQTVKAEFNVFFFFEMDCGFSSCTLNITACLLIHRYDFVSPM